MKELFTKNEKYIREVINPLLPNARQGFFISTGDRLEMRLFEIDQLIGSIYDYKIDNDCYFLHFTSIPNLLSILKTENLRMSELNYLEDKEEFKFANSNITDYSDNDKISQLKSDIFSLSLCEYSKDILFDEHIWETHGRQRKGACIKIKLHKNSLTLDFYLTKIIYKKEGQIKELRDLKARHDNFVTKYGWGIDNLDELLNLICSFYKVYEKFHTEKEIRLIKYNQKSFDIIHDIFNQPIGVIDIKTDKIYYYYELEVNKKTKKNPYISIENIYLGDKINEPSPKLEVLELLKIGKHKDISFKFMNFEK